MQTTTPYLDTLAAQAHSDGGWGYAPGQAPQLEPTCLALLALSLEAEHHAAPLRRGREVLRRCARPDGSYRAEGSRDEAVWPTALALFTETSLGAGDDVTRPAVARLLGLQGRLPDNREGTAELHDIDTNLIGWPWAEGNFPWVEPTAWACLALRRAGQGEHARVAEGLRLLLDRASDEGGINYGNRRVLGRVTEPIPGPTALMLLALQGRDHPRIDAAVHYLLRQPDADDVEHLCWNQLALDLYRDRPGVEEYLAGLGEKIRAALERRSETPWVRPAPMRQALAALALAPRNVFRLEASAARAAVEAPRPHRGRLQQSIGQRVGAWFRGLAVKAAGQLRPVGPQSPVHIAKASDYNGDLADVLRRQFETFRDKVPLRGKRVVLKPNLVEYHRGKVINTHPHFVAAVIELCRAEGAAEVIVAEGPGHWRNVEYLVAASGLGDVLRHYKVPFVDLNHDEPVKTPNLGRLTGLEHLYLSKTVATAEVLISLPKLKTHHWAGATLSLKNLFGTLPGTCYGWPKNELHWRGIDNSIVDIALTRTPDLAIVDGVVGMEGDGPLNGTPKELGAVVMGTDLVAVDATCCRLMELNPERIAYLVMGQRRRLGLLREADIPQRGETLAGVAQPFATVPHFESLRLGRPAGVAL